MPRPPAPRPDDTPSMTEMMIEEIGQAVLAALPDDPVTAMETMAGAGLTIETMVEADPDPLPWLTVLEVCDDLATPQACVMAAVLAQFCSMEEVRAQAEPLLTALAESTGRTDVPALLRPPPVAEVWRAQDVYGDSASFMLIVDPRGPRAGRRGRRRVLLKAGRGSSSRYGVMVLVDRCAGRGWVKDTFLADAQELPDVLAAMRDVPARDHLPVTTERVDPDRALAQVSAALIHTLEMDDPDLEEDAALYVPLLGLHLQGVPPAEVPPPLTDDDAEQAVEAFLASAPAAGLDADAARPWAGLLARFGADDDRGKPLRVGPGKTEAFLFEHLEDPVVVHAATGARGPLTLAQAETVADVVRAWNAWRSDQEHLSASAGADLAEATEQLTVTFTDSYDPEASRPVPGAAFGLPGSLEDVPDDVAVELAELMESWGMPSLQAPAPQGPGLTVQVRVDLRGAKPPIWRRLTVPGQATLRDLHHILQAAFGWDGGHLHRFYDARGHTRWPRQFGDPAVPDAGPGHFMDETLDEADWEVQALLRTKGDLLNYTYDVGDCWEHSIRVEAVHDIASHHPRCTGGRRQAPPDDCGGIGSYEHLREALGDPTNPGHAEAQEILHAHDPADTLDLSGIDTALSRITID